MAYPEKLIPLRQGIKTTVEKGNKLPRKGGQRSALLLDVTRILLIVGMFSLLVTHL